MGELVAALAGAGDDVAAGRDGARVGTERVDSAGTAAAATIGWVWPVSRDGTLRTHDDEAIDVSAVCAVSS